jgi:hypothetical protein
LAFAAAFPITRFLSLACSTPSLRCSFFGNSFELLERDDFVDDFVEDFVDTFVDDFVDDFFYCFCVSVAE